MSYYELLSQHHPYETEENHEKAQPEWSVPYHDLKWASQEYKSKTLLLHQSIHIFNLY
jgi:hypothetical protein